MKSDQLLTQLALHLQQLADNLAPVAHQRSAQARFDSQLFHTHSTRLSDYLHEAEQNMALLRQAVASQRSDQVAWMAERLVTQIAALQRELATQSMRKNERPQAPPGTSLYDKLAENQEFERRLRAMIADRESQLASANGPSALLQREIAALEGRLQRCRDAQKRIERSIEFRERQG